MTDPVESISPIDGRYRKATEGLAPYFSEMGFMKYRLMVSAQYLIALSENKTPGLRQFSSNEKEVIRRIPNINVGDARTIKDIEKTTNHDYKALEYYMKNILKQTSLQDVVEWTHFGLSTYDPTNIAYVLMVRDSTEEIMLPSIETNHLTLGTIRSAHKDTPMLAETHGQPATATTFGKEINVFYDRGQKQINKIKSQILEAKLTGSTGNFTELWGALPNVDWIRFSKDFIYSLDTGKTIRIVPSIVTTQIGQNESLIELFDTYKRFNEGLIDLSRDMWTYISLEWLKQKPKKGEVGSSVMVQKINPIDFENCEGNLGIANMWFEHFGRTMQKSRQQRDLSGSTIERNYGVALSHSLMAYTSLAKGLSKTEVNQDKMLEDLNKHPDILSGIYQTILRREGYAAPYEQIADFVKGKHKTLLELHTFIDGLKISDAVKEELKTFTPSNALGLAPKLAEE